MESTTYKAESIMSSAGLRIGFHPGYDSYMFINSDCGGRVFTLIKEVEDMSKYHKLTITNNTGHYKECIYSTPDWYSSGVDVPDTCVCMMISRRVHEALHILESYK